MAATQTHYGSLDQAWRALPDVPMIPDYGVDLVVLAKKVEIGQYSTYDALDILEALQKLIPSKHCLILGPSFGGTPVPISNMCGDALIAAATQKFKLETSPIIEGEFVAAFECLRARMQSNVKEDADEAKEMMEDMVFDQTLIKIAANSIKFFGFYLENSVNSLMFLVGNRKCASYDRTRCTAIMNRLKKQNSENSKSTQKFSSVGRTRKIVLETSDSESSESSSEQSSEEEIDEGTVTPIMECAGSGTPMAPLLKSYANLPVVNSFDEEESFAKAKAEAELAVLKAQQRLATLQANALVYQSQSAPVAKVNGPPLKTPDRAVLPVSSLPDYMIPKKAQPINVHYSEKQKPKKKSRKSSKREKKSSSRKGSSKSSVKKSRRSSSRDGSSSSSSEKSASEDELEKQVE